MPDRDPLDAICDVDCAHTRHYAMCAPCAAGAIRPELERLTKERDALKAALLGALETYRIHRQVRHPEPLADCITCGMGASIVNHLPPHLCAALTQPTEGAPSA